MHLYSLSQSLKFIFLMTLRMLRTKAEVQTTLANIQAYPRFKVDMALAESSEW